MPFATTATCFLLLYICSIVTSHPYLLLRSKAAKCVQFDVPRSTTLSIEYNAPDLNLADIAQHDTGAVEDRGADYARDGMDSRYNERMQQQQQQQQQEMKPRDVTILVSQRLPEYELLESLKMKQQLEHSGTSRIREAIEQKTGVIEFTTADWDGPVEICFQSFAATAEAPSRVSFGVSIKSDPMLREAKRAEESLRKTEETNMLVRTETSQIALDLGRMVRRIHEISYQADTAKDRETRFHDKSIVLNKAVRFWPKFRIAVLVLGGYLQASHIIRYMKARHIY